MNKLTTVLFLGTLAAWVLSSGIALADEAAEGKIRESDGRIGRGGGGGDPVDGDADGGTERPARR